MNWSRWMKSSGLQRRFRAGLRVLVCGADGMVEAFIVAAGMRATPTRMSLVAVRIYATRRISASDFVERHRTCE